MLQIRSTARLDEIEPVLRAAAHRHNASVAVVSHVGPSNPGVAGAEPQDAFVFTLCHSKIHTVLLSADIRFAGFLPCRVAAWPDAGGVMLEAVSPTDFCRVIGRQDMEPLALPLEEALREILEDAAQPMHAAAQAYAVAEPSGWGATEDQVNMRAALPQRIDCRGTKVEDEAGTGTHDAPGG
jgi:uncharacterized protein (DUF302 family)